MKSKYKVSSQCNDAKNYIYQVYRILDTKEIDHAGNREYVNGVFHDKRAAQLCADLLNGK